jgi:tryptophan-rich sensory protein
VTFAQTAILALIGLALIGVYDPGNAPGKSWPTRVMVGTALVFGGFWAMMEVGAQRVFIATAVLGAAALFYAGWTDRRRKRQRRQAALQLLAEEGKKWRAAD